MTIAEWLLPELDQKMAGMRKTLERTPTANACGLAPDKCARKPHGHVHYVVTSNEPYAILGRWSSSPE